MVCHKLAWNDSKTSSLWIPPLPGTVKANFDVVVKSDFSVAAIVFNATKHLSTTDAAVGEAQATLIAIQFAASLGIYLLLLGGDAINIIIAIQ